MSLNNLNDLSFLRKETCEYLAALHYSVKDIEKVLDSLATVKVLVFGEVIFDTYVFCSVLGKANKEPILAASHVRTDEYDGGILAIKRQAEQFCFKTIRLPTNHYITKTRYVDDYMGTKLFEVYDKESLTINPEEEKRIIEKLLAKISEVDIVIVADYGHGLITPRMVEILTTKSKFLCVNAQTNAGNRGYNFISKYPRADYICIDRYEAQLECRNNKASIEDLFKVIHNKTKCDRIMITLGKEGCTYKNYTQKDAIFLAPALSFRITDRMGAGDAVLVFSSLCVFREIPEPLTVFLSSVVGAISCTIVANERPVSSEEVVEFSRALLT